MTKETQPLRADGYPTPYDKLGRRIKVGDTVAWPSIDPKKGIVMRIGTIYEPIGRGCTVKKGFIILNENKRRTILCKPCRCVIVKRFGEKLDASV